MICISTRLIHSTTHKNSELNYLWKERVNSWNILFKVFKFILMREDWRPPFEVQVNGWKFCVGGYEYFCLMRISRWMERLSSTQCSYSIWFVIPGSWLLRSLSWRLFKQRNWATEDQTEFLSSVLLVGQLDEIIAQPAATDKLYVDSENCFDLFSPAWSVLTRHVISCHWAVLLGALTICTV